MRHFFVIIFLSVFSCVFSLELADITRNYQHRDTVYYLAENQFVPAFIDNTFQLDATLTLYQTAVSLLFISKTTPNYEREAPYVSEFYKGTIEYPYLQYVFEKQMLKEGTNGYATCSITEAIQMISKIYKNVTLPVDTKKGNDPLTRLEFLNLLIKIDAFNKDVSRFRTDKRKREDEYVGSAVSEYVLGYASALDKIELSKYSSGNKNYNSIFWKFASEKDKKYQKFNEDLSIEDLDILDKRLNQALLNFYNFKYWLVIQQCNIVLKEDPKNIGALKLKGSTYYMLRDFVSARKYWEKVLYYQPENKEMEYYLKILPKS